MDKYEIEFERARFEKSLLSSRAHYCKRFPAWNSRESDHYPFWVQERFDGWLAAK